MGSRRRRHLAIAVVAAAGVVAAAAPAAVAGTSWPTYHNDLSRSGADSSESSLTPIKLAWSAPLDGARVYGQPVVADGRVFVATEDDDVYALDAHDGHILWAANIGAPLQNVNNYSCGNISPLGITSTPVIDTATNTLFVVGEVSTSGAPPVRRTMVGFNLFTGQRTVTTSADPTGGGDNPVNLLQRAALAVANGRVYVGFGGQDGDCGTYHGWVVGVDEHGARPNVEFDVTPGALGGAVWGGGGGPSVDSSGNLYVTTGNQNGSSTIPPYAEAVVKLDPTLAVLHSFQDKAASGDADLGTGDALLLPNGTLFTVGKTDIGYVLRQSDLGLVRSISGVCGSDPDGGATYDAADNSVYVPCRGVGIQQVQLTTGSLGWRGGNVAGTTINADGSPILVAGHLWAAQYGSNLIQEIDPANGAAQQSITTTSNMPTFTTPSAADGLLLVGTDHGVDAFDGPSGPPPPASNPPAPTTGYRLVASDGGVFAFGTARFYGSLGNVHLAAPIVGSVPTVDHKGYWLVASDGGVFSFGDAKFYGSTAATRLAQPVVGMATAPDGRGYWLVARDGGVFAFGPGARFEGSTGGVRLHAPVVAVTADPANAGYWLFGADGGVFSFGGAPFLGSAGGIQLSQPVVGASAAADGRGYWMVARDGGIFNYGPSAGFHGSTGGTALNAPMVGMASYANTGGYWTTASDGGVFSFDAPFEGSTGGVALARPVVAVTAG